MLIYRLIKADVQRLIDIIFLKNKIQIKYKIIFKRILLAYSLACIIILAEYPMCRNWQAIGAVRICEEDDVVFSTATDISIEYKILNYKRNKMLLENNGRSYDYWYNKINLSLTAHYENWMSRIKLSFENFSDEYSSTVADRRDGRLVIENGYIDYNNGFLIRVGLWDISFGTEVFYGDTENTGAMWGYDFDSFRITAGTFKRRETKEYRNDENMFFLRGDLNSEGEPRLSFYNISIIQEKDNKINLHNIGIHYEDKFENYHIMLEGNKQLGFYRIYGDDVRKIDYTGYAIIASGSYNKESIAFKITLGFGSGDDNPDDGRDNKYNGSYIGKFDEADYEPDNIVIDDNLANTNDTVSNLLFVRLDTTMTFTENLKIIQGIGFYQHSKDVIVEDRNMNKVGVSKDIGTELDLTIKYSVNQYVKIKFVNAYFIADDGIGVKNPENAWKSEFKFNFSH